MIIVLETIIFTWWRCHFLERILLVRLGQLWFLTWWYWYQLLFKFGCVRTHHHWEGFSKLQKVIYPQRNSYLTFFSSQRLNQCWAQNSLRSKGNSKMTRYLKIYIEFLKFFLLPLPIDLFCLVDIEKWDSNIFVFFLVPFSLLPHQLSFTHVWIIISIGIWFKFNFYYHIYSRRVTASFFPKRT